MDNMKPICGLLFILLTAMTSPAWGAKLKAREFQSKILMMRVREILSYRIQGLESCSRANKGYTPLSHREFQSQIATLNQIKFATHQEMLEQALEVLSLTEKHTQCGQEIRAADAKLKKIQQNKFELPMKTAKGLCVLALNKSSTCLTNVRTILNELDPFCATQNSENIFGVKDPNTCMAGDRLLGKALRQKQDPQQLIISQFLTALEAKIKTSRKGSNIDLWKLFSQDYADTTANRKKFLALMAFFYYTLGTAGGYIDGIADHYWFSALKDAHNPEEIFTEFYSMKQKLDWYRHLIHKLAEPQDLTFSFKGVTLAGVNRHDYMAMFLACHFKKYGSLNAKIIPNILGIGYESLDFVSHLKGDVGLKGSIDNFNQDTKRYSVGSTLGEGFCNYKF